MSEIYLDVGATTVVDPSHKQTIDKYMYDTFYNPSANYTPAFNVSKKIEYARSEIARYIGCNSNEIYFTSGASESNSWALQGWIRKYPSGLIITSPIEHHSIKDIVDDEYYSDRFWTVPVDVDGAVIISALNNMLSMAVDTGFHNILVAIQYANNEIGTVQNVSEISNVAHAHGAKFFTDATQAFSCLDMSNCISESNIDMLSMSGHKIRCPKGIGILYIKDGIDIPPLVYGSQNFGKRGGTENVASIISMGDTFHHFRLFGVDCANVEKQRDRLFEAINNITPITMNGSKENRLPNNLNITFKERVIGTTVTSLMSALGVYISVGSACTAQSSEPSHVLKAIGMSDDEAFRTIRITLPNNIDDKTLADVVGRFRIALELLLKNKTQ